MRKLFWIFFVLTIFVNCTPQKRLDRIFKRHPELKDTVKTVAHDTIPEIKKDFTAEVDTSTNELDAFFDFNPVIICDTMQMKHRFDSTISALKKQVKAYVNNRKVIADTIVKRESDITVKVFQKGKDIGISIFKPQSVSDHTVTVVSRDCPPCETKAIVKAGWYIAGILFLLILLILYIYEKGRRL